MQRSRRCGYASLGDGGEDVLTPGFILSAFTDYQWFHSSMKTR